MTEYETQLLVEDINQTISGMQEKLKKLRDLIRSEPETCLDCKFLELEAWQDPCNRCSRSHKDYFIHKDKPIRCGKKVIRNEQ